VALGEQAYQELLKDAKVVPSGREADQVKQIGRRIAKASEIEPLQREINLHLKGYRFDWEFKLIKNNQVNAFCLPGGKVGVFTGLLEIAGSEDQLATVMSHEIAHALAHHASERIARAQKQEEAANAAKGFGLDPALIGILSAGAQVNSLKYDRQQETEADKIGLFLMTFAGYRPEEAVVFWERMGEYAKRHGPRPPGFLSDHPTDEQRIRDMHQWVPQAKAAKKALDEGRVAPAGGR